MRNHEDFKNLVNRVVEKVSREFRFGERATKLAGGTIRVSNKREDILSSVHYDFKPIKTDGKDDASCLTWSFNELDLHRMEQFRGCDFYEGEAEKVIERFLLNFLNEQTFRAPAIED